MQPQILLADDHTIIRKGLKLLLQLQLSTIDVSEGDPETLPGPENPGLFNAAG
jgi:hypothetical protein